MRKLLSVCLITKNEEENISECLNSVKSVADEIIVVDTGSTDKTIEIAKKFGANVFEIKWEDDFSKARNISIEQATSEFILIIDADEKLLNPDSIAQTLFNVNFNVGGWLVEMTSFKTNKIGTVDSMTNSLLRLIRNHKDIRFNGIIHEQVFDSIYKLGFKISNSSIKLEHKGYNLTAELARAKQERNYKLLLKAMQIDPENLYLLNHLGKTLSVLGKIDEAFNTFQQVIEKSKSVGTFTIEAYNQIALIYFAKNEYEKSIEYAKKSIEKLPNQPFAYFILGDSYLSSKQFDLAYYSYKEILSIFNNDDVLLKVVGQYNIPKEQIYFKMGEALSNLGVFDDAIKCYEDGLKINSTDYFCLLGIYNTLIKMKKDDLAYEWLKQVSQIYPSNEYIINLQKNASMKINNNTDTDNKVTINQIDRLKRPLLTLAMIVKNEERFLQGCLESVQGVVDEIVIVDTGSNDKTIEIAKKYNSKIIHFKWINDFAAARNESLKNATGQWILYLDADERLAIEDKNKFRNFLQNIDESIGGINCLIESEHYKLDGSSEIHRGGYPRLFRNLVFPNIQFRGRVHEQISPSILEQGKSFINSDIKIIHLGYNQERSVMEQKIKRNYELLLQHVKEEPTNGYAWYQLGQTLAQMRLFEEAEKSIKLSISCGNLSQSVLASASATLAQLLGNKKEFEQTLKWSNVSLQNAPNQIYAAHLKAFALLYLNQFEESEKLFKEILVKIKEKKNIPQSGFDVEIPEDIILKGLQKAINRDSSI